MVLFDKKVPSSLSRSLFGLTFPHPLGSMPGEDPMCRRYNKLLRSGFVEIGPVSPADTTSRESRRRARTSAFERLGWKEAIHQIQSHPPRRLIACNIAPLPSRSDCESVTQDLLRTFTYMYDFADLFIIDTFRKNKDGIAPLQTAEYFAESLDALIGMRFCYDNYKPILIRVDTDIQQGSLAGLLDYMMYSGLDGIIAGYQSDPLDLVRRINHFTSGRFPIVACGGITTPGQADALLEAGVSLLQVDHKHSRSILNHLAQSLPSES